MTSKLYTSNVMNHDLVNAVVITVGLGKKTKVVYIQRPLEIRQKLLIAAQTRQTMPTQTCSFFLVPREKHAAHQCHRYFKPNIEPARSFLFLIPMKRTNMVPCSLQQTYKYNEAMGAYNREENSCQQSRCPGHNLTYPPRKFLYCHQSENDILHILAKRLLPKLEEVTSKVKYA